MMLDSLDISLLREINVNRMTALDNPFILITDSAPILAICIPLICIVIGLLKKRKKVWMKGLMMAASYILAAGILNIIKVLVIRPRPFTTYSFIQKLSNGGSSSFPSGHTSDAFAVATIVSFLFPKVAVVIPMFIWAALVGYSRMDLGVHYPSDVVGGAVIGAGSSLFVFWLYHRSKRKESISS